MKLTYGLIGAFILALMASDSAWAKRSPTFKLMDARPGRARKNPIDKNTLPITEVGDGSTIYFPQDVVVPRLPGRAGSIPFLRGRILVLDDAVAGKRSLLNNQKFLRLAGGGFCSLLMTGDMKDRARASGAIIKKGTSLKFSVADDSLKAILLFTIDDHPDFKGMMCIKAEGGTLTAGDIQKIIGNRVRIIPTPRAAMGTEDRLVEALAALIERERGDNSSGQADGDLKGDVEDRESGADEPRRDPQKPLGRAAG